MNVNNPYISLYDEAYFAQMHKLNKIGNNFYREKQRLKTIENLCDFKSNDAVLELGCGTGLYTHMFGPKVRQMVGVDFSNVAIKAAVVKTTKDNVSFLIGDIQNLSMLKDQSFDKIFAMDVLEHLSNAQLKKSLREIKRLLKKGGIFVFFTPCRSHWIEFLKDRNIILTQFEEHIGVRTEKEYIDIIQSLDLKVKNVLHHETCIPILRDIERTFINTSFMGTLFVSRLGMAISKWEQ